MESIARVSERFDKAAGNKLGPLALPAYDRDPEFLQAWQLDTIATYMEKLAEAQGIAAHPLKSGAALKTQGTTKTKQESATVSNPTVDYSTWTDEQLQMEAATRGVSITRDDGIAFTRDEIVDALTAADGVTEDDQQAEAYRTRTRGGQSQERAGDTPGHQRNQPGVKGEGSASQGNKGGREG